MTGALDIQRRGLGADLETRVGETIEEWRSEDKVRRLWSGDASLWTASGEERWLGWLNIATDQLARLEQLERIGADVRDAGFRHALLLGMGGSSLCPELLSLTFGSGQGHPGLRILDSTDPAQVRACERELDLERTLFIVSSKSGTTLEPDIFQRRFFALAEQAVGADEAPSRFVAITDPGSALDRLARETGFRHVAHGVPSIGGRYSALSDFGMVPAAIMGIDIGELLGRAERMARSCGPGTPVDQNPGLVLGATIGAAAVGGRDKLTLVTSPAIGDLGAWLEQLLAESTGKQGRGVIPVDREPLGPPDVYGEDRLFAYVRLATGADPGQDAAVDALERAGQPVLRIEIEDLHDVGGELFRWEFATAVAGAVIGINPFDQPDVESSKIETRRLTDEYEQAGSLPGETPLAIKDPLALFADERNASELAAAAGGQSFEGLLAAHLARIRPGDYVALLAFVEMTGSHEQVLARLRTAIRDRTRVATCAGFGPRFLHSTGQAYKGGPNSGVFVQITCDDADDVPIPQHSYTFGVVKAAQARGDLQVLAERGRRLLRVHVGADVGAGLAALERELAAALGRMTSDEPGF